MKEKRKIAVLVGDGMGDYPVPELNGRTPLQAARIPWIRRVAGCGSRLLASTVPSGVQPGSDVANMSLLGYDPQQAYTGRAPIEAAGAGIALAPEDVAFRCNLVTIEEGRMLDYSAGDISSPESQQLVADLQSKLGREGLRFYPGVGYRHLLVWKNGPVAVRTQPPHDIANQPVQGYLPAGARQDELRRLLEASREIFAGHPVNQARRAKGERPASQIWLWGQGRAMTLQSYAALYGLSGSVVSAVDLIRGLGRLVGLDAPKIPGANGFIDTNFAGKVSAAVSTLQDKDFVYVHLEAPDECGHRGLLDLKVKAIELFDEHIVGPIWDALEKAGDPYRLIICTDHRTPIAVRGHTPEPIPFAWVDGPVGRREASAAFDEFIESSASPPMAYDLMRRLLAP